MATKDKKKLVNDIMADAESISADDPDIMEKLTLIAQKVAEAQGKVTKTSQSGLNNISSDPMNELGCEGCQ